MTPRGPLTLYSKPGCHLCEELRALLDELQPDLSLSIEEIDITGDEALFARYRYEIPVLVREGVEIARGRIGAHDLVRRLTSSRG